MNKSDMFPKLQLLRKFILILLLGIIVSCTPPEVSVTPCGIFGPSRLQHVLGQDGVSPIHVNSRVAFWTFSDTILGTWKGDVSTTATFSERADITTMISNSLAFTGPMEAGSIKKISFSYYKKNGIVQQFIRHKKNESPERVRLWALDGIRIKNSVYVYYLHVIIPDSSKLLSFRVDAIGLARWNIPHGWKAGDPVSFKRLRNVFGEGHPAFGACVMRKDGYLYTVGQYMKKDFSSPIKISRVKTQNIENGNSYEFLRGDGSWVHDVSHGDSFLGDVQGECSLSYNRWMKKYIIVYCQSWKNRIMMVLFDDFSKLQHAKKKILYTMPRLPEGSEKKMQCYYSGKEIYSTGNIMYTIYINPLDYQPYLIKATFGQSLRGIQ